MTKYFIIGLNKTGTTSIRNALSASLGVSKAKIFKDRPWNTGHYKELNEKYKDSKFILTIRDQEEWWTSVSNWLSLRAKWTENLDEDSKIKKLNTKIKNYNNHFNCDSFNKDCYINYYNSYNNAVIEYFKDKSNLYVLNLNKDFNWKNIQKIVNLNQGTMIKNIKKSIGKKKYLPDNFNGKMSDLRLKDLKFLIVNKNILI
jgi:hypothetical protein